jgi:hypothetical protein
MTSFIHSPCKRTAQLSAVTGAALLVLLMAVGAPAGIQGSGHRSMLAIGTVTAVGTGISVSGVTYSTAGADIEIDGTSGSQSQLEVGDIVAVLGSDDAGQTHGAADQISFSGNVRGPVSSIDVFSGTFLVLGQTIRTNQETIFSRPLKSTALAGIGLGGVVEVRAASLIQTVRLSRLALMQSRQTVCCGSPEPSMH